MRMWQERMSLLLIAYRIIDRLHKIMQGCPRLERVIAIRVHCDFTCGEGGEKWMPE